jgi:hypothetical protein
VQHERTSRLPLCPAILDPIVYTGAARSCSDLHNNREYGHATCTQYMHKRVVAWQMAAAHLRSIAHLQRVYWYGGSCAMVHHHQLAHHHRQRAQDLKQGDHITRGSEVPCERQRAVGPHIPHICHIAALSVLQAAAVPQQHAQRTRHDSSACVTGGAVRVCAHRTCSTFSDCDSACSADLARTSRSVRDGARNAHNQDSNAAL